MKKSRWVEPYIKTKSGGLKPALKDCWTCAQAGVYLIRHIRTQTIVYVGSSSTQLKKTIYRHFQTWNDKQPRRVYPKQGHYQIRFFKCTAEQAAKLEAALIAKYQPKDNLDKFKNLPAAEKTSGLILYKRAKAAAQLKKEEYLEDAPF